MNTNTLIRFLGWTSLTYLWLEANCLFFCAIIDAINEHDEQIRQQVLESKDDSEDESEAESEDKGFQKSYIYTQCLTTSS